MEILLYSIGFLIIVVILFFLFDKPYKIATLFIFLLLYQFNIETPFLLDARGFLLLLLFGRLYLLHKDNMQFTNYYLFRNGFTWFIIIFTFLPLANPLINLKIPIAPLREIVLSLISLTMGFILLRDEEGRKAVVLGIILSAIFCSIDLLFTFFTSHTGTIDTIKLLDLAIGKLTMINHNYPGYVSSMGLLFIYLAWYQTSYKKYLLVISGILLVLGVFISTSRSALLAIVVIFTLVSFLEPALKKNFRKIVLSGFGVAILLTGFFFIYNLFLTDSVSNNYTSKIYYRLFEEPLQLLGDSEPEFNKWTGEKIEGSITFRSKKWQTDFGRFINLGTFEQLFGLGPQGYLKIVDKIYGKKGNIVVQYTSHNGYLMILLERGILGLVLFLILIISISITAIKLAKSQNLIFPFIYLLHFIIIYSFAQNSELTNTFTYLILGCILGDIVKLQLPSSE